MKCTSCGAELAEGTVFCTSCGSKVAQPAAPAVTDTPVVSAAPVVPATPAPQPVPGPAPAAPAYQSPAYQSPAYQTPAYQAPVQPAPQPSVYVQPQVNSTPISPLGYIGYNILFNLPLIGIIMLFVFSFSNANINRKNYARSYLIVYAVIIILSILGFILTLILGASLPELFSQFS